MEPVRIGVIGGTGVYSLPGVENLEKVNVETPYGKVAVNVGTLAGKRVAFLTRHGEKHSISPGQINYRGNIRALSTLGVKQVFATACSGSLNPAYPAGSFALVRQFIEFTKARHASFFENDGTVEKKIGHVDLTEPYCPRLSQVYLDACAALGLPVKDGATYACMEGPRFETRAEIKMLQMLGADLVAQTSYPEMALAREDEMCYASMGIVANMGAGIEDDHVDTTAVQENMAKVFGDVQRLLVKAVELVDADADCWCKHALENSYA